MWQVWREREIYVIIATYWAVKCLAKRFNSSMLKNLIPICRLSIHSWVQLIPIIECLFKRTNCYAIIERKK